MLYAWPSSFSSNWLNASVYISTAPDEVDFGRTSVHTDRKLGLHICTELKPQALQFFVRTCISRSTSNTYLTSEIQATLTMVAVMRIMRSYQLCCALRELMWWRVHKISTLRCTLYTNFIELKVERKASSDLLPCAIQHASSPKLWMDFDETLYWRPTWNIFRRIKLQLLVFQYNSYYMWSRGRHL